MKDSSLPIILIGTLFLLFLSSCSTTKNLPEGEIVYTGQKPLRIENLSKTPTGLIAMEEVETALATPPNNSFLGSSRIRIPLPTGLWIYNSFVNSKGGLGKWIFNRFAAQPVFISTVNPNVRVKVASNLLHDYGYFNGTVNYEMFPNEKNPRKAKLQYLIDMKNPYVFDSIAYEHFPSEMKQALLTRNRSLFLHKGDQFSVVKLDEERNRLSTLLRNRGYYYLRPDFISYRADTTRTSGKVDLQITPKAGLPTAALQQWHIGDIAIHLYGVNDEAPNDSLQYENINIRYYNKLKVRPEVLRKSIRFEKGQLFTEWYHTQTQSKLTELGIFRYAEIQYASPHRHVPREIKVDSTLNVMVKTTYDLPYDSELELNLATKSNDQTGPGVAYNVTKRNVFGGGETFSIRIRGSYEWQNRTPAGEAASVINSYELGGAASLVFPRVLLPKMGGQEYDFPATTTFHLNATQLNRARFFKMLSFGGDATYTFQPTRMHRHTVTPFKLTFNTLQRTTKEFDDVIDANPILSRSLSNQFIPAMDYTYTYDNANYLTFRRRRHNLFRVETSFTSAGNVTSLIYKLAGKGFDEQKDLLGAHFAQFLKLTGDIRYTWYIDKNQSIATRLNGGILYSYGNSTVSPYSEQFFIGGANSIRAFTVRSIGPGSYRPEVQSQSKYSYMDQTGDIKLEGNLEYRFRLLGNIHGAVFLDAGNIWMLRDDPNRTGERITLKDLPNDIALGTGAGLRYDLSVMVIRLDCGVALHTPYQTSRKGYYNIPQFTDGLGFHFAVGYPF
ncbi:Outer membrane protein assembly factor BamA [termite gut metagenome]|uniref:Outer membrane protein assembly factor BamA n=1 Tax=termite gut metagenome TaxID=433724 RepID=A0A5J4QZ30_9ZZZZ